MRPREVWHRFAAGTGVGEVRALDRRVRELEAAVAENTELERSLVDEVAALEAAIVAVVDAPRER